jgi:hypothetical protein
MPPPLQNIRSIVILHLPCPPTFTLILHLSRFTFHASRSTRPPAPPPNRPTAKHVTSTPNFLSHRMTKCDIHMTKCGIHMTTCDIIMSTILPAPSPTTLHNTRTYRKNFQNMTKHDKTCHPTPKSPDPRPFPLKTINRYNINCKTGGEPLRSPGFLTTFLSRANRKRL